MSRFLNLQKALFFSVALALSPLLLATPATSAITPDASTMRITADKQTYNLEKKKYYLTGKVTVAFQDIRITGSSAEVDMDDAGKPQVANFFNRPMFKRIKPKVGEDRVVGDIIRVYLSEERYGAQGNVDSVIATVAADPFHIRSDIQEFDNKNKVMSASGNVMVDYQGSQASSALANVRMKENGKADRVIFTGGAHIKKDTSDINGDRITVMVDSGNLIAEHNVKTRVDLKKQSAPFDPQSSTPVAKPASAPVSAAPDAKDSPDRVFITSDYQQYDKASDQMLASGNVKIVYGDYVAVGPKATFRLKNNDLDRIFLTGRPTITDNGRTVTADKITITTNPKNFDAVGNVKVNFKTASKAAPTTATTPAKKPLAGASPAGKPLQKDDPSAY